MGPPYSSCLFNFFLFYGVIRWGLVGLGAMRCREQWTIAKAENPIHVSCGLPTVLASTQ